MPDLRHVREKLLQRAADLNHQHDVASKRNNPSVHPLVIAARHEEVLKAIQIINEELGE